MPLDKEIILNINGVADVTLWHPVSIHHKAQIGSGVVIGRFTNICGGVKIGNNCRIQGFCYIPEGVILEDDVFVGPMVCFTNVKYPKVREAGEMPVMVSTVVRRGASIGAGATICPGVIIGKGALVGAGSVVTRNVLDGEVVKGNPAE